MSVGLPKPVLYVVDGLGLSGKTRTMAFLAQHLDPERFQAHVCTFSDENGFLGDQLRERKIPIHYVPCSDGLNFGVVYRLIKLIRACRAEVVHCFNPRPILYGGLAAKLAGVRQTVGFLSAFACQVPDRNYDFLPQPLTTSSRRNIYRNRLGVRLMRHIVTVAEPLGRRFCEYSRTPMDRLRVIPYGADLSAVERVTAEEACAFRRELGYGPDDVVIGSVGRLVEQKDYPTQLKAFAISASRAPNLRMVLAGAGPLDAALREMVQDLGIEERVHFLGHWERVPLLLRSLDVFVLASKFEPFGVALLEAKAAGVAIVATRVNEIPEIIDDGDSGLLTPAKDPEKLAECFLKLAEDTSLRAELGEHARTDARERHSLESVVRAYQSLYQS
jgi:glycosyltransferase involved in cell wall biosynthesis